MVCFPNACAFTVAMKGQMRCGRCGWYLTWAYKNRYKQVEIYIVFWSVCSIGLHQVGFISSGTIILLVQKSLSSNHSTLLDFICAFPALNSNVGIAYVMGRSFLSRRTRNVRPFRTSKRPCNVKCSQALKAVVKPTYTPIAPICGDEPHG